MLKTFRLARSIEDRVSDSLNQVLTQRFVDRRAAILEAIEGKFGFDVRDQE